MKENDRKKNLRNKKSTQKVNSSRIKENLYQERLEIL